MMVFMPLVLVLIGQFCGDVVNVLTNRTRTSKPYYLYRMV